ncbi:hypothetical protein TCAL_02000 [Tigriopus californicus]|uniref:Uncharacterized protein n=1 Tax=Tigriopus californicus TaxID=6832 RepID=A0A553PNQ7_TIGCA|nr:uncharacterized protein LOC131881852 [Tigriopus californicus]TRY79313.1 hypothetical protein TCAL_02000 [Tigriopus californicus]|eukprot:TCALIF_02000-PA protein Name:"Protein of unknown function" AED:0.00 eAED:0.00 QI:97/1/1/1/1/1/2/342/138
MFSFFPSCLLAFTLCSTLCVHMVQSDSHSLEQDQDLSEPSRPNEAQEDHSLESNSNFNSDFGFGNHDDENLEEDGQINEEQPQQNDFDAGSFEGHDARESNGRDGDPIIESFRTQLEDANRAIKGEPDRESFHFEVDQ